MSKPHQRMLREIGGTPFWCVRRDGELWMHSKRACHGRVRSHREAWQFAIRATYGMAELQRRIDSEWSTIIVYLNKDGRPWPAQETP
jgi:hypothetical protein